ncbi:MAG: hypothetical protein WBH41_00905 [Limnochordia bacterium]|jgi:HEPN domain-containing protein
MVGLFSRRFKRALDNRQIPYPSFSRQLRNRLAKICQDHEVWSSVGYYDHTTTTLEVMSALKKAYGKDVLLVLDEKTAAQRDAKEFKDFMEFSYPHCVLDALEAFYRLLPDDRTQAFQVELNQVLDEERSPWRMTDGRMYLIDSRFLDALKDQAEEEMKRHGFLGAYEEFRDAREHLQAGDIDDAIHKANCALESVLKSLLDEREGTAGDLLKKLRTKTRLLHAVPDEAQKAITSCVLQGLPALRHKLGGHGQGAHPIDIPRAYGDLAINLAAAYVKFLLDVKKESALVQESEEQTALVTEFDDDLPS